MKREIEKDKKEINKLIEENNLYKNKNNELKEKIDKYEQEKIIILKQMVLIPKKILWKNLHFGKQ